MTMTAPPRESEMDILFPVPDGRRNADDMGLPPAQAAPAPSAPDGKRCWAHGANGEGRCLLPFRHPGAHNFAVAVAAPAPSAEPPAQAATERMGTHWETCATDGGPRHYDCALRLIEQQAREIAELRNANSSFASRAICHGSRADGLLTCPKAPCDLCLHWQHERAERAEAEAKEANERAHNETERRLRAEAERDALRECVRAADGQLSRVLHELAGSASLCWEPKPTGAFHSTQACEFVAAAIDELRAILRGDAASAKVKL